MSQAFRLELGHFLADLRERLGKPDPGLNRQLRLVLLDTAATAIANLKQPELLALQRQHGRLSPGKHRLPGFCTPLAPADTALVLATSACWDELVEGYAPSHGRPALHAVPLCLSLGQSLSCNLNTTLEALFLAYELGARLGESYQVPPGEHGDGTWGTAVAALTAAVLLDVGASAEVEAVHAALCQMSRSLFAAVQDGASCRLLYPGLAASRGLGLALAAAADLGGPEALEQDSVLLALKVMPIDLAPRTTLAISGGYVKLLPGARHLHYAAEAARLWRQRFSRDYDFESDAAGYLSSGPIQLRTYPEAIHYCGQSAPANRIQAQFSLAFAVAASLRWGKLGRESFTAQALDDPALRMLMGRIQLVAKPDVEGRWAELVMTDADGALQSARVDGLPGDPDQPVPEAVRLTKAKGLLQPVLGEVATERLVDHWLEASGTNPLWPIIGDCHRD
jgi:2-methylcitrate dehydratase PrpD